MIVYCHCSYTQLVPPSRKRRALEALLASGREFRAVPDLCALAARETGELKSLVAGEETTVVVACAERAVRWILTAGGVTAKPGAPRVLDLRRREAEDVLAAVGLSVGPAGEDARARAEALHAELDRLRPEDWIPWFPVIDYDRCIACKKCLNFCLFGVYRLAEEGGREVVRVAQPRKCKTHCPACARVCPQTAVIFPKHPAGPIDGDDSAADEPVAVDVSKLSRFDVYAALRARSPAGKEGGPASVRSVLAALEAKTGTPAAGDAPARAPDEKHP